MKREKAQITLKNFRNENEQQQQKNHRTLNSKSFLAMEKDQIVLVTQSPTLCHPMDFAPGSSVHGVLQARITAMGSIPFSRGSSPPRD